MQNVHWQIHITELHTSIVFPASHVGSICIYSTLHFEHLHLKPHIIWSSEAENVRMSAAVFREKAMGLKLHTCMHLVCEHLHPHEAAPRHQNLLWQDSQEGVKELSPFPGWTSFITSLRSNTVARGLMFSISVQGKRLMEMWVNRITLCLKN